ncbi:unnamed protein product [Orchesella dallaii]|uniref:Uncharacterized protein n=1 Tax=Orchesella dallaii TaxID=48710 RepID=A0ABP1SB23_9HEXA
MKPQPSNSRTTSNTFNFNVAPTPSPPTAPNYTNPGSHVNVPVASNQFPRSQVPHLPPENVMSSAASPGIRNYAQAPLHPSSHSPQAQLGQTPPPSRESPACARIHAGFSVFSHFITDFHTVQQEHNQEIFSLRSTINEKDVELRKLLGVNHDLHKKVDEKESIEKELVHLKNANTQLTNQVQLQKEAIKWKDDQYQSLMIQCGELQQRARDCENAKRKVETSLGQSKNNLTESEARITGLLKQVADGEKKITEVENEKKQLKLELGMEKIRTNQSKAGAERVLEKNEKLEKKLREMGKENKRLKNLTDNGAKILDHLHRKFVEAPKCNGSESGEECSQDGSNHENSTRNSEIIATENVTANSVPNQTVIVMQTEIEGEYSLSIPEDLSTNEQEAARKRPRASSDDDYYEDEEAGGLTIDETPLPKRMNLDNNSFVDAETTMEHQPESSENSQAFNKTSTSNSGSYQQSTYATQGAEGCLDTGAVAPPPNYGNGNTTLVAPNSGPSSAESSMEVASVPHHQCWETTDEMRARMLMSNSSNEIMQMLRRKEIIILNQGKLNQLYLNTNENLRKKNSELDETLEEIKSNLKGTETRLKNAQAEINGLKRDYNNHTNVINNLAGENQKLTAERNQLSKLATTNSR